VIVVVGIVAVGLFFVGIAGMAGVADGQDAFAQLFSRPTTVGGELEWGPTTVAAVWLFDVFSDDGESFVLSGVAFQGIISALLTLMAAYMLYRVVMRLLSL